MPGAFYLRAGVASIAACRVTGEEWCVTPSPCHLVIPSRLPWFDIDGDYATLSADCWTHHHGDDIAGLLRWEVWRLCPPRSFCFASRAGGKAARTRSKRKIFRVPAAPHPQLASLPAVSWRYRYAQPARHWRGRGLRRHNCSLHAPELVIQKQLLRLVLSLAAARGCG